MTDDVLRIDDEDRYARFRLIAWWDQDKLAAARVLVVGAGALGNEVLKNLAMLGVGHVTIVDYDDIEESNLTRSILFRSRDRGQFKADVAARTLRDINPDISVSAIKGNIITDVGLGLFADVDVVIGCLDNREARLWVNRSCWKVGTPWIDGGIQEISGVAKVFVPPDGACYECAMTENDYRLISLHYSCPLLKQEDLAAGKVPTAPTIASIIGGLQTQEALKLIHGMPVAAGAAMIFNGVANTFYTTKFQHKENCLSHDTWPAPVELPLGAEHTGVELLAAARPHVEGAGAAGDRAGARPGGVDRLRRVRREPPGDEAAATGPHKRDRVPAVRPAGPARAGPLDRRGCALGGGEAFCVGHPSLRHRAGGHRERRSSVPVRRRSAEVEEIRLPHPAS